MMKGNQSFKHQREECSRKNRQCRGPKVGTDFKFLSDREISVAGAELRRK